ncbi:hypothetical protein B0H19DRAFT_104468 [Mycena capillaripes]|nr:hypothetical protein B0H19DRAFT_104468 [Mycena capillaripes]
MRLHLYVLLFRCEARADPRSVYLSGFRVRGAVKATCMIVLRPVWIEFLPLLVCFTGSTRLNQASRTYAPHSAALAQQRPRERELGVLLTGRASKDFDHRVPDAVNGITTTTTASSSRVMGSHCLIPERGSSKAMYREVSNESLRSIACFL